MNNTATTSWHSYLALCKPKIVALIVFTAVVGMLLSTPAMVPWEILIAGTIGIGLAAASAAALNHVVDEKIDSIMSRTQSRPLPRGSVTTRHALIFAATLCLASMLILILFVNTFTAVLTLFSLIGYGVVYSMYLKRATPQNIVIGGAAGAAPPVLGWAAVSNSLDPHALLLFLIIFAWTPPHFWALAVYRRQDYAKADIPMLPVTHGTAFTQLQILLYTLILFIVSLLPYLTLMSGLCYLLGAVVLGLIFLYYTLKLIKTRDDRVAMQTFSFSIWYLLGLFAFLLLDHYIPLLATFFLV
ncbi:MAG: heme o synthase [Gammaproteobacteria bacterium]